MRNVFLSSLIVFLFLTPLTSKCFSEDLTEIEQTKQNIASLIDAGDYQSADVAILQLESDFSDSEQLSDTVYRLANEYLRVGRYEDSEQLYKHVAQTYPLSQRALDARIGAIRSGFRLGNFSSAKVDIDSLIAELSGNPKLPDIVYLFANEYLAAGKYEDAMSLYESIVADYPTNDKAFESKIRIARSNFRLKNYDKAQTEFDNLITEFADSPELSTVYYLLANEYLHLGKYEDAGNFYKRVAQNYPDSDYALNAQIGAIRTDFRLNRYVDAQSGVDNLITNHSDDPKLSNLLYQFAGEYMGAGEYEKAKTLYQNIVENHSACKEVFDARVGMARAEFKLGNYDKAQVAFDKLKAEYATRPELAKITYKLANEYLRVHKFAESANLYKSIVQMSPNDELTLNARIGATRSDFRQGNYELAKTSSDDLIADFTGKPQLPEILYLVACEYLDIGKYEESKQLYSRIVDNYTQSDRAIDAQVGILRSEFRIAQNRKVGFELLPCDSETLAVLDVKAQRVVDDLFSLADKEPAKAGHLLFVLGEEYFIQADKFLERKKTDEAHDSYLKAIAIWDDIAQRIDWNEKYLAYYYSGSAYKQIGDYTKSIASYKQSIEMNPNYAKAWYAQYTIAKLYESLVDQGKASIEDVKDAYQVLLKDYPDCSVATLASKKLETL